MTAAPDVLAMAAETGAVLRACPGDRDRLAGWLLAELSAMVAQARAERDEAAALLEAGRQRRQRGGGAAMTSAEDAESAYDRARFGIVSARAALMQYAAPLPGLEVTIPDDKWEIVRKADAVAGEAEGKMDEALEIIRTGLLGWPPPESPGDDGERDLDG